MSYSQLSFIVDRDVAEDVSDYLVGQGALSITVESADGEECFDAAVPGDPEWQSQRLNALFDGDSFDAAYEGRIRSHLIDHVSAGEFTTVSIEEQDWERCWLEQFEPVKVADNLWVCPSWLSPPEPDAINLFIDPGLAFGTGTHPTTQLCLRYLAEYDVQGKAVMDYGCGSGILGIAALKLGASSALGMDIDSKAVDASTENAIKNGVSDHFRAVLPENCSQFDADIVIANILAGTLIELHDDIVAYAVNRSILMLSGILEEQQEQVLAYYQDQFEFTHCQQDEWILLVGTRR